MLEQGSFFCSRSIAIDPATAVGGAENLSEIQGE
jgi:hypothetical protein